MMVLRVLKSLISLILNLEQTHQVLTTGHIYTMILTQMTGNIFMRPV